MRSLPGLITVPVRFLRKYRLFRRAEELTSPRRIILWWEARRLFFNLVVGLAGLGAVLMIVFAAVMAQKLANEPIEWPDPLFAVIGVVLYAIAANACYTGGWVAELAAREVWGEKAGSIGEISFTFGMIFSVLLTLLPGGLAVLGVVSRFVFLQLK